MSMDLHRLMSQLLRAWNSHDLEAIVAFYAADYHGVDVAHPLPYGTREGVRRLFRARLAAFPDLQFAQERVVAEIPHAALFWRAQGTHWGTFLHIPPTGRRVQAWGGSLFAVRGGLLRQGLHIWDVAGLLRSLGLLPEL